MLPAASSQPAPDEATTTLIARQRDLFAALATRGRQDLQEYVAPDIVIQLADTSRDPQHATYTYFNLVNGDIVLPHGGGAEYRAVVSDAHGTVTAIMDAQCVVTSWTQSTSGWRAIKMQILPASPAAAVPPVADTANPLQCTPGISLPAALLRSPTPE